MFHLNRPIQGELGREGAVSHITGGMANGPEGDKHREEAPREVGSRCCLHTHRTTLGGAEGTPGRNDKDSKQAHPRRPLEFQWTPYSNAIGDSHGARTGQWRAPPNTFETHSTLASRYLEAI